MDARLTHRRERELNEADAKEAAAIAGEHARHELEGTAFPQLADALTSKVCEALRGMPGATAVDFRAAEVLIASQLLTGQRSAA